MAIATKKREPSLLYIAIAIDINNNSAIIISTESNPIIALFSIVL